MRGIERDGSRPTRTQGSHSRSAFSVAAINRRRLESSRRGFNGQIAKFRAILVLFRTASFHFPLVGCSPVPWEGFALGFGSALLLHRGDGSHPLPTSIQLQLRANCHLGACLLPRFSLWTVIKSLFHNRNAEPCLSRKLTKPFFSSVLPCTFPSPRSRARGDSLRHGFHAAVWQRASSAPFPII